ncbi:hypothetical protein ACL00U_06370 [Curtobacterium poinsettiae]|uniref:ORC-CDC6 family AAA ATPase n=1 Tax=Curtobacterium poinsettiae TaxID=159612 RepID=UPI0039A03B84
MIDRELSFEAFNAKKLTASEVAKSFVVPDTFRSIAGTDHSYLIGPRGSGKTTLLRMLTTESLNAWQGAEAKEIKKQINFWSVFLPTDQLWSQQASESHARSLFALQGLYAFTESASYLSLPSSGSGVRIGPGEERKLVTNLAEGWGLDVAAPTLLGLQQEVDRRLIAVGRGDQTALELGNGTALSLLDFSVRTFNRVVDRVGKKWALLLDEMELAPRVIHEEVNAYVRGGSGELLIKVSMSPFDRFIDSDQSSGVPVPGHDFRVVHLSGQARHDIERITIGLWRETLKSRGLPAISMERALGGSTFDYGYRGKTSKARIAAYLEDAYLEDNSFAEWVRRRRVDLAHIDEMTYQEYSATVRKVYPLLVFRRSLLNFSDGNVVGRRSGRRATDPFVGVTAVTTALEGNPRWIKIAFSEMVDHWDMKRSQVSAGYQLSALLGLSSRFEALLRVLPRPESMAHSMSVMDLVNVVAKYMSDANLGSFHADPVNVFTVDRNAPPPVLDAIITGLYAGAIVHVRDRLSPDVLDTFAGQRFRLAYVFGLRPGREFPLRLGKDVRLSSIVQPQNGGADRDVQLEFDWS